MQLLTLLLCAGWAGTAGPAIILGPPAAGDGPAALVIVQGAAVYPHQYVDMGQAIQNASSVPLWVGICEGFLGNFPNPLQVADKISDVLHALSQAGMPDEANDYVFLAAHSLGGIVIQGYLDSHASSVRGVMLWGSYLTSRPLAPFPLPILHLSGTLDGGQARPTRMAQTYAELAAISQSHPETPLLKPVIILQAVDHAHFFSGEIPPEVANTDIKSELEPAEARQMLAARCAAFLAVAQNRTLSQLSRDLLLADFNATGDFLQPLYRLQRAEADGDAAEWPRQLQLFLLNVANQTVSLHTNSRHEPDLNRLQRHYASCAATNQTQPRSATIDIFSSVEHPFNPLDASPDAITSSELAVKMVSQQLLHKLVPSADLGPARSCRELNQETMRLVQLEAPLSARRRFSRRGKPVIYQQDRAPPLGALWAQQRLQLTYTDAGLTVQSLVETTDADAAIAPGNYWCKLLAPSRALEYILTDGLRGTEP